MDLQHLSLDGVLLLTIPSFVLAAWFSWLVRRSWLRGGPVRVTAMWLTSLAVVSCVLSTVYHNNSAYFGVLARTLEFFGVLMIAGAIPSGVIALVVSWFAHRAGIDTKLGTYFSNHRAFRWHLESSLDFGRV